MHSRMTTNAVVILSEHGESKDPGTNLTANVIIMRRFLDSANASLGMTYLCSVPFADSAYESG